MFGKKEHIWCKIWCVVNKFINVMECNTFITKQSCMFGKEEHIWCKIWCVVNKLINFMEGNTFIKKA